MSEVKRFITRYSRDYQGNLQEDPNGSWVLAADAAMRDKRLMDKIAALQERLTETDQRNDELSGMLKELVDHPFRFTNSYRERISAALNPCPEPESHLTIDALKDAGFLGSKL